MSGDDLFSMADERSGQGYAPLAVRMRPESLDDIYGQDDLIGPGSFLRTLIEKDTIPSLLFYGPSGVGKTTLAHVIANETDSRFVTLNAVTAGTAELRKVIAAAQDAIHLYQKRTILSSMKYTASIKVSKTSCCRMSKTGRSSSSGRRRKILISKSTAPYCRACASSD